MNRECLFPPPKPGTFTVYYKPTCPYSQGAINLLQNLRLRQVGLNPPCLVSYRTADGCPVPFKAFNAEAIINSCFNGDKMAFFADLQKKTYKASHPLHKTFPVIFGPMGQFIGGFTELQKMIALNQVKPSATLLTSPSKGSEYPYTFSGGRSRFY